MKQTRPSKTRLRLRLLMRYCHREPRSARDEK